MLHRLTRDIWLRLSINNYLITYMNYIIILIGTILSFWGYRWAFNVKHNPNYYIKLNRSEKKQNILQTFSTLLYPGSYLVILFSFGFNIKWIIINLIFIVILNSAIFPMIMGFIKGDTISKEEVESVYNKKRN